MNRVEYSIFAVGLEDLYGDVLDPKSAGAGYIIFRNTEVTISSIPLYSISIDIGKKTNNQSQLTAIKLALIKVRNDVSYSSESSIVVYSHSLYCITALTVWALKWAQTNTWHLHTNGNLIYSIAQMNNDMNIRNVYTKLCVNTPDRLSYWLNIAHENARQGRRNEIKLEEPER